MRIPVILSIGLIMAVCSSLPAQYRFGISSVGIAATSTEYGLPFYILTPIHPGVEASLAFLEKEKAHSTRDIGLSLGYYYHDMIAHAIYLNLEYGYQWRIAEVVGLDLGAGVGFLHSIYPGSAYAFDESVQGFNEAINARGFGTVGSGIGISYIGTEKFQPFLNYEFRFFNPWEMNFYVRTTAMLKLGVKIKISHE